MWINSRFVRLALFSMLMALWLLQIDAHASGSVQWKALGPYRSGPVRSIAVDPTNIEVIYAGTDAGVYRSIDGGLTWEPAGAGLGIARRVNTLAVDPSNPSVLYAGTNDGVYKSWNGAITWVKSSRGIAIDKTGRSKSKYEHTQVVAIAVHPSDSELLYASTTGKESLRFFKSTDGGASWESQGFYGPGSYIAFDPQIPTSIYGLYKYSTDGGESWSSYRYGDTGLPSHTGLKVDPSSAATLYAWNSIIGRDTSDEGIYKSTDGGGSWHQVRDGDAAGIWVTQSGDVYASVRGGREGDGIFAYGLHMSRDGGNLWEEVDAFPLRYGEVYAVVGPSSDRRYAGSDAGFARSTDGGRTWSVSTDGLPLAQVNSVAIGGDGSIYAGTESVGLLKLAEGGNHWTSLSDGLPTVWAGDHRSERLQPINSIYADTSGPGRLLVGVDSGIYSDGGGAGVRSSYTAG